MTVGANAQQTAIDSLLTITNKIKNAEVFDKERFIDVCYELCAIYYNGGDYLNAITILDYAQDVYTQKTSKNNSLELRNLTALLTSMYYNTKNTLMAHIHGEKAEKMFEEARDYDNKNYWNLLATMSSLCSFTFDTVSAQKYNQKAFELYKKNLKKDIWNPQKIKTMWLQSLVQNFGVNFWNLGDYEMAAKCFMVVMESYDNDLSIAGCQTTGINLSMLLTHLQHYKESTDLLNECIPYCKDLNSLTKIYQTLAINYAQLQDTTNGGMSLAKYNNAVINGILLNYTRYSNLARYDYMSSTTQETTELNNWMTFKLRNPIILKFAFDINATLKYYNLTYPRFLEEYIKQSDNQELKNIYSEYKKHKLNYVFDEKNDSKFFAAQYDEQYILDKCPKLDKFIFSKYKSFDDIVGSLSDDELIIQFCDVSNHAQLPDNDLLKHYYTAYIVSNKYICPIYYFICRKDELDSCLLLDNDAQMYYNELYSRKKSSTLYSLIFKSLKLYLETAKTIYFASCGDLSNINFDLLTDSTGTPLNQKYKMVRVSSIANIPEIKSLDTKTFKTSALYGGIDYKNTITNSDVAVRGVDFRNLPNTGTEIKNVAKILTAANIKTDTICGENATEESFKKLSGNSPDILHIATHGFYLDENSQKPFAQNVNTYSQKESAMVLAGLALSGADKAWKGNFENVNSEDGILTAYEISQLDLSNTKLVVLSACETARGKIFPVDGVFGLQRAFKQAGAGSILMSLWKVDDGVTAIFMEHFYKFLFETNDRHKALKLAQEDVKKKFPDPYYWAAWVMLD